MSVTALGRRYERLLFLAGPLAFASVLVMFVALASNKQETRSHAKCLRSVAELIEQDIGNLEQARQGKSVAIMGNVATSYWMALTFVIVPWEVKSPECKQYFKRFDINEKIAAPQVLLESVKKQAAALEAKPLVLYGVELPEKATISLVGTPVKMDLLTLVRVMQMALGPILLLWLGSLYNTRHRETVYISRMTDISMLYPHLINVYPAILQSDTFWNSPRKRSWLTYGLRKFLFPAIYALARVALLASFIVPAVSFYLIAIYMLRDDAYSIVSLGMGILLAIFTLGNIFCECLPWHVQKRFMLPRNSI